MFENTRVVHVKDGTPCEVQTEFTTLYGKEVIEATHTPIGALNNILLPFIQEPDA